ncbi:bifunctional biotin--[acetyl-CoA-carboxylase] ligase/biotin operon repressor BirA [Halopseudomonas salegens]|uniref:Bifunctional ligase/repressor BirA n=1 Tax=Halopseudomonas salegens TaxID=1434072 RepID=A0A1H2H7B2_9GAMM|nr:bifunctional biotin--[acetyl-CoA-carboxylase] ligase/biotin operon repressor BirA [Halopseudomonas salegens]SDU27714.1 BirA family transcriptional regulator, biotin operon repressor / biotin-[acetyl-CoA-carboxylase] ligase [Halopseudomonas salegens]
MLKKLLALMADGEFHSGEVLAADLGVSRAAVWKALQPLVDEGFPLQRVRGRGYRIPRGAALLDEGVIQAALPAECAERWRWHLFDRADSTNTRAHHLISLEGPRPLICLAEQQSSGRGRRGRAWSSPYAQNIYLTLVEPFTGGAQALEGLSLVVGLVLVETLAEAGFNDCQLKWPNDVLYRNRKLAGILIEIGGDLTADCVAIIGVGINVHMRNAGDEINQPWTSLAQHAGQGDLNRNHLIAIFLSRLHLALERFRVEGFIPFRSAWEAHDAWLGCAVQVQSGERVLAGTEQGVDANGGLRLQVDQDIVVLNGGELSLRLQSTS